MKPKMLIVTRFGIEISDPAWFEHRLDLFEAVTLPSLLAQSDQNFVWFLRVGSDLAPDVEERLIDLLAPFEGRACLLSHREGISSLGMQAEERGLTDENGFLLVGRIDDDDAWAVNTVAEVRERSRHWRKSNRGATPGLGLTFDEGLVWLMYDMIDVDYLERKEKEVIRQAGVRQYRYPFHSMSGYTYAKRDEAVTAAVTSHASVESLMRNEGYSVKVINTIEPMWLYCRHKQTDTSIMRSEEPGLDIALAELEEMFGISATRSRRYIDNSVSYGYAIPHIWGIRGDMKRELKEIDQRIPTLAVDSEEREALLNRRNVLISEIEDLSENTTKALEGP